MGNLPELHVSPSKWYVVPFACVWDCHSTAGVSVATRQLSGKWRYLCCLSRITLWSRPMFSTEACLALLLNSWLQICVQLFSCIIYIYIYISKISPITKSSFVLNLVHSNEKRLAVKTSCENQQREGIVNGNFAQICTRTWLSSEVKLKVTFEIHTSYYYTHINALK